MNFEKDRDRDRRRTSDQPSKSESSAKSKAKKKLPPADVGNALRTVYQRTIDEDIPPEMLDLLGKLG